MGSIRTALGDTLIAAFPVALVYFSGWAYLTSYLGQFGIDATQLNISFTTVLVYAFVPLKSVYVLLMIATIVLIGFAAYAAEIYQSDATNRIRIFVGAVVPVILALIIVLLFVVRGAAAVAAKEMADNVWKGDKSHSVVVLADHKDDDPLVQFYNKCRNGRRLRQIIGLPDEMFLMCRSAVDRCNRGTLFVLKDGRIIYTADKVREGINDEKICTE